MFDIKKDIQAMTTFRRNPAKFMKHLKKTKNRSFSPSMERPKRSCRMPKPISDFWISPRKRRKGRYPSRIGRPEKGPRASGAQSAGNVPAQPCNTSLG